VASPHPEAAPGFPRLRLREPASALLDLPWELPLARWPADRLQFKDFAVGPSRHLVRFLVTDGATHALKELPLGVGIREYTVLRHLESLGLPAVQAVGIAGSPERDTAILITEYLAHSLQYRRLLMRFPLGPGPYRDRLLDAMAWLLVDLHRAGVFWGDCSLANTLFRRDGDKIQAYLVDAETGEVHPSLTDGQRRHDLEILVENVAFGLADLAALQGLDMDDAVSAAWGVRDRYLAVWDELHATPDVSPGDRQGVRARVRRLNELGFAVDEINLEPTADSSRMHVGVTVTTRRFHANALERLTGVTALEGQAQLLLNDLREYRLWLEYFDRRPYSEAEGSRRWLTDVLEPTLDRLRSSIGRRDPLQAYCDVLEHKWILSEDAGRDVGLDAAIEAYISFGAPAPEDGRGPQAPDGAELDWAGLAEEADPHVPEGRSTDG
jgi:hypothetical protein